jgi:Protein of unknown function (DUF1549)/Protein of unknown function (DUF1553)
MCGENFPRLGRRFGTAAIVAALCVAHGAWLSHSLAAENGAAAESAPAAVSWSEASALTATINAELASRWSLQSVVPAAPAGDAEFLRRVYLDVAGRIPSVSEVRDFLEDPSPDRRERLVDRLLDGPAFTNHFARTWRATLIPEADANAQLRFSAPSVEGWFRGQLRDGQGYDEIARQLLTTPVTQGGRPIGPFDRRTTSPVAFYFAKEGKPENLAATTARTFLGVRLECAQCHDHPFAHWKREQFWQLASFFAGIERQQKDADYSPLTDDAARHELRIPDTERDVSAAFLDGSSPTWAEGATARGKLAEWVTSRENRYFSRALANRMWAHFFGMGLVDPVDDLDENNPPSHPALLDVLAERFASHGFRIEYLIRAITLSRAYQFSSSVSDDSQRDPRRFAVMPVRGLSADQLFDSLSVAVGYHDPNLQSGQEGFANGSPRSTFVDLFNNQRDKPIDYDTSIIQAMAIMNGQFVAEATNVKRSAMLGAIAQFPGFDAAQRLETMYLASLSRLPRPDEAERLEKYVADGGPRHDTEQALGDVYWALLNSSEFLFNH